MEWFTYVAGFFAGAFLTNFVLHFVQEVCGNRFPTVFSKPRGKVFSSPTTNVLRGVFNLILGYTLLKASTVAFRNIIALIIFFSGVLFMATYLSKRFLQKEKE